MNRRDYHDVHPSLPTWLPLLDARLISLFEGERAALSAAATAVVASPGKRLRPVVSLLACDTFGAVTPRAVTFAALMEVIHTASLVHDDVLDEAPLRRGALSAPARWGNKFAVLLGDFLLSRVFEIATCDGDARVMRVLAATATEMCRAVTLELTALNLDATEEIYWQVIRGKTASLFAASMEIGACLGGASVEQQAAMRAAGDAMGMAFQLADDLLDLQGSDQETGKPAGADLGQHRATLPLIHVMQTAPDHAVARVRAFWEQESVDAEQLSALRECIAAHGGFDYAWWKVKEYRERAGAYLESIPAGAGRDALLRLCHETFPLPVMPAAL